MVVPKKALGPSAATLADVARAAGVSVMTASRAMTGRGYVSAEARAAVIAAVREVGYVPNRLAQGLRNSRTRIIGVLVADIVNGFYAQIAKTVESVANEHGYQVVICNSDESGDTEARLLIMLGEIRVDGLLVTPTVENAEALRAFQDKGSRIVQIDRVVDGVDSSSVLVDNGGAIEGTMEYLEAAGHRRVVVISGPQTLTTGRERADAARRYVRDRKSQMSVDVVESSFRTADAKQIVAAALERKPTAIVAGNNVVAEACVELLNRRGIRVPEEISIVAFDDVPWMQWLPHALTAVRQPVEEMSEAAVRQLISELESEPDFVRARFSTYFVERQSVAPPPPT